MRRKTQDDRGRAVVHDQGVLGTGERHKVLANTLLAVSACSAREIQFDRSVSEARLQHCPHSFAGKDGAAQTRMEDGAAHVHRRGRERTAYAREFCHGEFSGIAA